MKLCPAKELKKEPRRGETFTQSDYLVQAGGVSYPPVLGHIILCIMSDFSNWHFNFSLLTLSQRQTGHGIALISDGEIQSAIINSHQWHNSAAFPLSENHYFLIGYTNKLRFLLVALSYSDDETLTIHDVAIADESQVQEIYCGRAAG